MISVFFYGLLIRSTDNFVDQLPVFKEQQGRYTADHIPCRNFRGFIHIAFTDQYLIPISCESSSTMGDIWRQEPHQAAQKITNTGTVDCKITVLKLSSVTT